MTTEELRALDVEIHTKVMGEKCYWDACTEEWCQEQEWFTDMDGTPFKVAVPEYSDNMQSAWELVEKLALRGHRLVLEDYRGMSSAPGNWSALFDYPNGHDGGQHVADTAPLAICRAALKAITEGT